MSYRSWSLGDLGFPEGNLYCCLCLTSVPVEQGALEGSEVLGKLFSGDKCFEVSGQSPVRVSVSLAIAVSWSEGKVSRRVPGFCCPWLVESLLVCFCILSSHDVLVWWAIRAYHMETIITPESVASCRVTWGPRGLEVA